MIDYGIAGRVAIVTGGSRGVGRGCALALAQQGVKVCIAARRPDVLEETASEMRKTTGAEVLTVPADMSNYDDIKRMVATVVEHFGQIDILVNNAANFQYGLASERTDRDWINQFEVKTFGYLRCILEASPHMQRNHWGRIVNIAGGAARQSSAVSGGTSGAVNAAIINMTKTFSDSLAKDGITANAVHPGASDSDRRPMQIQFAARTRGITEEEAAREMDRNVPPIGRRVMSADTGQMVLFFCSEQAGAITGQTIAVDGGSSRGVYY